MFSLMAEPRPPPDVADPTDPDVRREIIETVRRFVAGEVIPVASALEHEDRFPAEIVEPDARPRSLRGHHPRGLRRARASTC